MPPASSKPLTERQQAVMVRIDRRVPIKVIAQDLGVSETRINQHIRALKNIYDAGSLGELVERYRATMPEAVDAQGVESLEFGLEEDPDTENLEGLSEAVYTKNQVPIADSNSDQRRRADLGELLMSDVQPMVEQAPWLRPGEPKVVPGVLDGEYAVLFRFGAIIAIAFGFLAAVVLTVTAAVTISEALDGRATIPVDQEGYS